MTKSRFVVVKHDAKRARLHYDLRFVMPKSKIWASFAVRKGIPLQPGTKVLAVRTHDHSEKEALMFGTISKGYGAGRLTKWDDGQCIIHKYSPGHIAIEFKGRKVKGLYHMVSTGVINRKDFKKQSYMLFKSSSKLKEDNSRIPQDQICISKIAKMCRSAMYGKDTNIKLQTPLQNLCVKMMNRFDRMCRQKMYYEDIPIVVMPNQNSEDQEYDGDEPIDGGALPWGKGIKTI